MRRVLAFYPRPKLVQALAYVASPPVPLEAGTDRQEFGASRPRRLRDGEPRPLARNQGPWLSFNTFDHTGHFLYLRLPNRGLLHPPYPYPCGKTDHGRVRLARA